MFKQKMDENAAIWSYILFLQLIRPRLNFTVPIGLSFSVTSFVFLKIVCSNYFVYFEQTYSNFVLLKIFIFTRTGSIKKGIELNNKINL